jgi:hypothetical protein
VVGAPGEDSNATGINGDATNNAYASTPPGAAYVYHYGTAWAHEAYVKVPEGTISSGLGGTLAFDADGNRLVTAFADRSSSGAFVYDRE